MSARSYSDLNPLRKIVLGLQSQRRLLYGIILAVALMGFEIFNYSTTELALSDLLGDLRFAGFRWATILAIAFCGIDFAGIARLFLPESHDSKEVWYLMGAWLLAATMNAVLTWWSISLAIVSRDLQSSMFISREILTEVVPVFIAILVWVTRILLIGTFSFSGTISPEVSHQQTGLTQTGQHYQRPVPASLSATPALRLTRKEAIHAKAQQLQESRPEPEYVDEPHDEGLIPAPELIKNSSKPVQHHVLR
ncbi:MAG: hypothetical protein AB1522_00060 [Chloroflexota bacterium]